MFDKVFAVVKRSASFLQKLIERLLITLMLLMTIFMFTQVVLRVAFGSAVIWFEEMLRYMFIWVVFLGLPTGIYHLDLTRFDMLVIHLSGKKKLVLETFINATIGVVLFEITRGIFRLIKIQFSQYATSIQLPMGVVYMIIPVSAICALFFLLINTVRMWAEGSTDQNVDFEKEVRELEAVGVEKAEGDRFI